MDLLMLSTTLLPTYLDEIDKSLVAKFQALTDAEISTDTFSFYTSVSSVYSSKIEGEQIDLDSYVKYKRFGVAFLPDYTRKIDDLYQAYTFAKTHPLNQKNIAKAHALLSKHLVAKHLQGVLRKQLMYVSTPDGKIEYVAAEPDAVPTEMEKYYHDLAELLSAELTLPEVFFYAAMLHLVFVKIHPWSDGNGRCARLIEKWFLAQKLGERAWYVQSEKHYYAQHENYYRHLRALGLEYQSLDYSKALPFLKLLPAAL